MFGRKKDEAEGLPVDDEAMKEDSPAAALSRLGARQPSAPEVRPQQAVRQPEVVRRPPDIHATHSSAAHASSGHAPSAHSAASHPTQRRHEPPPSDDAKKLIVGRDIVLSGEITACDKLVVEGRVEASIKDCREIEIAETGTFKGAAEIEVGEISGTFEGSITAHKLLVVRATGRVIGTIRFGQLEIERGGQIAGDVKVLDSVSSSIHDSPRIAVSGG
jgi:cytoskeletal protein CcmA (bactofilin family)